MAYVNEILNWEEKMNNDTLKKSLRYMIRQSCDADKGGFGR